MTPLLRAGWLWAPPVVLMAAIFAVSGRPTVPDLPAGLDNHTGHLAAYAALAAAFLRAFAGGRWTGVTPAAAWGAWAAAVAYGATDEVHQMFVPGRTPAWSDWLADAAGASLSAAAARLVARRRLERPGRAV